MKKSKKNQSESCEYDNVLKQSLSNEDYDRTKWLLENIPNLNVIINF